MLRSAFAKAPADMSAQLIRRNFSVGGQARHEGYLVAINADAGTNLLILSLTKDLRG